MKKKKKAGLNRKVTTVLVLSGLFQSALISLHVKMIINLYSQLIGLYMFAFVLMTIMNILNGSNFTSKKSMINVVAIYVVTGVQTLFGALFIQTALNEAYWFPQVTIDQTMILSIGAVVISIIASITAAIMATRFQLKASEIDMYLS